MNSFLFPGQGSQHLGMGLTLFDEFKGLVSDADDVLGYSIKSLCSDVEKINLTQYTQPALYVVNALSYLNKIRQTDVQPDYFAGHSLGEYNALHAAGVVSFIDGLKLVKKRGKLMSSAPKGAMAAVIGVSEGAILSCLEDAKLSTIDIANYNSTNQTVISGLEFDITHAREPIEKLGGMFIPLNTSGAFHSRYMAPAQHEFSKYLRRFEFSRANIPVISNVSASPHVSGDIARCLAKQITSPVKWLQTIHHLLGMGEMSFIECGPGKVLYKLVLSIQKNFDSSLTVSSAGRRNSTRNSFDAGVENSVSINNNMAELQKKTVSLSFIDPELKVDIAKKAIESWNSSKSIGSEVKVKGYLGGHRTRAEASLLFGRKAVIYLEGFSGYFDLEDVSEVEECFSSLM